MENVKKEEQKVSIYLILFVVAAVVVVVTCHLTLVVSILGKREPLMILGRALRWNGGFKRTVGFFAAGAVLISIVAGLKQKLRIEPAVVTVLAVCFIFSLAFSGLHYARVLARQGVGTIQGQIDIQLQQDDLTLKGELGIYAGYFETADGDDACFICTQVDVYGPFSSEQIIPDRADTKFSEGEEYFAESLANGQPVLRSVTMRHYDDGYWVILKRFVNAEDVRVEVEHLGELCQYAIQADYEIHRDKLDARALVNSLRYDLGDLVS